MDSRKNKITEKDIIRQIREVLKHNSSMDVFICLRDKKTESISTFTSDKTSFSLKTVAKLVKMQKIKASGIMDQVPEEKVSQFMAEETTKEAWVPTQYQDNESSFDSKKLTNASTNNEIKSENGGGSVINFDPPNLKLNIDEPLKSMIVLPSTPLSCPLEYNTSLKFGSTKSPVMTPKRDLEQVQEALNFDSESDYDSQEDEEYESDDALNFKPRFPDATVAIHA